MQSFVDTLLWAGTSLLSKVSLPKDTHLLQGFMDPHKSVPKWHLNLFSHFCTAYPFAQHTDYATCIGKAASVRCMHAIRSKNMPAFLVNKCYYCTVSHQKQTVMDACLFHLWQVLFAKSMASFYVSWLLLCVSFVFFCLCKYLTVKSKKSELLNIFIDLVVQFVSKS